MQRTSDKLIVLDVDLTLIYASLFSLQRPTDLELGLAQGYLRPGARDFVAFCLGRFARVGVWTAATADYAHDVLAALLDDPAHLAFIWTCEQCTRVFDETEQEEYWAKDLSKLGVFGCGPESIIVVDDDARAWGAHRDNVLPVPRYDGGLADRALAVAQTQLGALAAVQDVRSAIRELRGAGSDRPAG